MRNFRKIFFVALLFIFSQKYFSQEELNFAHFDKLTYDFYSQAKWREVVITGKQAIAKGFDYYYMRMRIGIAYYEQKNYLLAEPHFVAALKFSSNDLLAQEYLYYCYAFDNRLEEARNFSTKLDSSLLKKIGIDKPRPVDYIIVEGGVKKTDSAGYYNAADRAPTNTFQPAKYFQVGIGHYVKNRFSLLHAATFYSQVDFVNDVTQMQYYLKSNIPFNNGFIVSPAFHFVHVNSLSKTPPTKGGPQRPPVQISQTFNFYLGSLLLQKRLGLFNFGLLNTILNSSSNNQILHGASISCAPFGNPKLNITGNAYLSTKDNYSTNYFSVSANIQTQPINLFWLKTGFLINNGNNIVEDNGYLINNSADLTQWRAFALINFNINKQFSVYGLYLYEKKLENAQKFNYKYNGFVFGIKIIPN